MMRSGNLLKRARTFSVGWRVRLRVRAVELEGEPIHEGEPTVTARHADVNRADVDLGKEGVDRWDVFENMRMGVDLQNFLVDGRGAIANGADTECKRAGNGRRDPAETDGEQHNLEGYGQ